MPDFTKFDIYLDESATQERFTVIGAMICQTSVAPKFARTLDLIVERHGGTSELKWGKVKKHNLPMYRDVVAATLNACRLNYATYYALVIDNSKMDHKLYNEGDKEIGFNKMLFQLLYQFVRKYRSRPRFYAYLDDRTTKHTPERLRRMLNGRAAVALQIRHNPFRVCQFRKSHEVRLIQAVDILAGAIAFHANVHYAATNAAKPKVELMRLVEGTVKSQALSIGTTMAKIRETGFDVWRFDFSRSKKPVRNGVSRP